MRKIIFFLVIFCSTVRCEDKKPEVTKVFKITSIHSDDTRKRWHATAFYISKTRLLTAAHVLTRTIDQWIDKNGHDVHCRVVRCDHEKDIAVLETDEENDEFFRLVSIVKVMGFPEGKFYQESTGSIDTNLIHARCHFVPGMSGGPVVNEYGDVEGMGVQNKTEYDCKFIPSCVLAEFVRSTK